MRRWRSAIPSMAPALVTGLVLVALLGPMAGSEDGPQPADPFGPPEGPIPFPIVNVSSSYDEDRFPSVLADSDNLRVIWNKGARDMFVYHVVSREYDGQRLRPGEDWVSVEDTQDHDFAAHEHYSHEGSAVRFAGQVWYVFASDDPNYTAGPEHDIVLRSLDPETHRWGPFLEVTPNDEGEDRDPEVAVVGGRMVIAWRTNDPGKANGTDDDIVLRTFDGAAFSAIIPVSPDDNDEPDAALDMAVVDGRVALVWEHNNRTNGPSDWDVLYREWDGTSFTSPPIPLAPDPSRVSKLPRVAGSGNTTMVVWESRVAPPATGATRVQGRMVVGGVPGTVVDVTRVGSVGENLQPDVVAAGNLFAVLWSSFDDSLTHGPDSDIVMVLVTREGLPRGDVIEVSHPRDGPDVDEGFVVGCVFQKNLYAVWRMMYPVDPSLPLDVPVNEDIVMRRVTDLILEVEVEADGNPRVGDEVNLTVTVRNFWGAPVKVDDLGISLAVERGGKVLPSEVELTGTIEEGVLKGTFVPKRPGTHTLIALTEGRELATLELPVYGEGGEDDDGVSPFVVYIALALVAVIIALIISMRKW